jgi:hypothetical protein
MGAMLSRKSETGIWIAVDEGMSGAAIERSETVVAGERRLMIAVLANALRSLFRDADRPGRGAARRLRQDLGWLTSRDRVDPFAFERICEALGLDATRIRVRVLDDLGVRTSPWRPVAASGALSSCA